MKSNYRLIILLLPFVLFSCKKGWLEEKPDQSLVVPKTTKDFQAILDNTGTMNVNSPALGEASSDDYYLLDAVWQSRVGREKTSYTWEKDIFQGETSISDWNYPYRQIFNSNVVLEGIKDIDVTDNSFTLNNLKGSALFYRAFAFHNLAEVFSTQFSIATADSDLGIPLKINADVKERTPRATIFKTYDQIINDLKIAVDLLPQAPQYKTRPSKPAAYAMLARVYLTMENYEMALKYSDSCLQSNSTLIDFNSLGNTNNPFVVFNAEVIFHSTLVNYSIFGTSRLIVDSTLYKQYNINDLRRSSFFFTNAGNITFKGSYAGSGVLMNGLATDEVYMIRAECNARLGNVAPAMKDLNDLLRTRWKKNGSITTYVDQTANDKEDALNKILMERRKELVFRGLRWMDLKRLNKYPDYQKTLIRKVNSTTYTLPPNDPRYVLPIPDDEIRINNLEQNPRL